MRRLTILLQRVVLAPLLVVGTVLLWTTLPLWLLGTGVLSAFVPGWLRPVRLLWVLVIHLSLESIALVLMFAAWVASGFGWWIREPHWERFHYDIVQFYLRVAFREARRVLRLEINTVGPTPDAHPGQPLLVFSRHAGPGDSFTLIHALMNNYQREPRVVLKQTLTWDPALGVVFNRLPSRFISANPAPGHDQASAIRELATDLDENDAFVLFPEGGNFTPRRRTRSIDRLRGQGHEEMAVRAESMRNVLAPRPGGVLAALDAAPEVDVLLVSHTGLDHVVTLRDLWRYLPMDKRLLMGWWRVPRSEIPTERAEQIEWLYEWWQRIDEWVEEHRPLELPRA